MVFAAVLRPVVRRMERWHLPAPVGAAVLLLGMLALVAAAGSALSEPMQAWLAKAPVAAAAAGTVVLASFAVRQPPAYRIQTNLIMPEPTAFLSRKLPACSIIRPTATKGAAMAAVRALTADGLFIGQSKEFFKFMKTLATEADLAVRQ